MAKEMALAYVFQVLKVQRETSNCASRAPEEMSLSRGPPEAASANANIHGNPTREACARRRAQALLDGFRARGR
jgi:hypothetical protein